jgi:hypothetical protein
MTVVFSLSLLVGYDFVVEEGDKASVLDPASIVILASIFEDRIVNRPQSDWVSEIDRHHAKTGNSGPKENAILFEHISKTVRLLAVDQYPSADGNATNSIGDQGQRDDPNQRY